MKQPTRRNRKMAFLAPLLGMMFLLPGCAKSPRTAAMPITEVQQVSFSQQGMARNVITNRTIRRTDSGAEIVLEIWDGQNPDYVYAVDAAMLEEVRELLETYNVGSWNGFRGSSRTVLDGESFGFYVQFTDGSTITAYGSNDFPTHYYKVYSALWDLTAPAQQAYERERPDEYPLDEAEESEGTEVHTPENAADKTHAMPME